ncbi:IS110 family transposase [Alloyangia pacifica]|uniref:IS110 family transposase n=1 Tax=Alloyangia pacifica TaxID=311180 RepID=UPI001CFE5575|nr:IS110 family transposase [Alloyangia pacifica]
MEEVSIIGIDIAKNTFQLHEAGFDGAAIFRKALPRARVLEFLSRLPSCVIAMEACSGAHYWERAISALGHEVRLIAPRYVKPYVKRQKNDAADAEAIAEAASRPSMRFVAVKSADQQAQAMLLKTRELLTGQRTQTINALRGHPAEHGLVVPQGTQNLRRLQDAVAEQEAHLPAVVVSLCKLLTDEFQKLTAHIDDLTLRIRREVQANETAQRLSAVPGIGPITAMTLATLAPPTDMFRKGRDFAAWVGLTPRQHSTGGKTRLGKTSKMGQKDIRRLLIIGAMAVIQAAGRTGGPKPGSWLAQMLSRKPRMLVAVALANKMARVAWALISRGGSYRVPA